MRSRIVGAVRRNQVELFPVVCVVVWIISSACVVEAGWREEKPHEYHPSSHYPDRIILTWSQDPATTQSVTWRTDTTVSTAYGLIAKAGPSADFAESAQQVLAETSALSTDEGVAHHHSITFTDLSPGTLYAYRVGSDDGWSEWFQFRTASDKPESFSFIYLGDAQNAMRSYWARAIRQAYSDAPHARFIVHAGDLVNRGYQDAHWGEWFEAGGWILAMLPSIPAVGNHEYHWSGTEWVGPPTPSWKAQFTLPANGLPGLEEQTYYIDYQGLRLISLNSNERHEEQAGWLAEVLEHNPGRWTVVTFHHPVLSGVKGGDQEEIRRLWEPLFDRYGVDLALTGHHHVYARGSALPRPSGERETESGTVYVVSVSGPKMYDLVRDQWMHRAAENTQLYQVITVTSDTLHYRAMTVTGDVYDSFDLVKRKNGPNLLVETLPPGTPERIFD